MTDSAFVEQLITGLTTGCVYALVALALVMIYQTTHLVNFAQGEMAVLSTYLVLVLISRGMSYWAAFAITLGVSFLFGVAVERLLMRRFSGKPVITIVIVMVGMMILFNGIAGFAFGYEVRRFDSPFDSIAWLKTGFMSPHEAGVGLVTLIVLFFVYTFFRFTKLGLAMRGAAANPLSSQFVGIDVGWILALGWGLAAAIGAIGGVMTAPMVFLDPNMMLNVILYSFAGAVLGGISNPWGAVAGGLMLGVAENLVGAYLIGSDLKLAFVLAVIVAVLTLAPNGLFGRRLVHRV